MAQVGSPFQKPPIPSPTPAPPPAPIAASAPSAPRSGSSAVMWALIAGLGLGVFAIFWFGLSRPQQSPAANPAALSTSGTVAVSPPALAKPKVTVTGEERRAAIEAVTALKALNSATSVGVVYQEYMRRLADTKIVVDRSAALVKSPPL